MTLRFAVVYEAPADFKTATELADRVLVEPVSHLDPESLHYYREWIGETADGRLLTWTSLKRIAEDVDVTGYRIRGKFPPQTDDDEPDAKAARRAILTVIAELGRPDAILFIRDADDQPERRRGLEQARNGNLNGIPIVIGFAVVEREAWVLCGFDVEDEADQARLAAATRRLKFDPTRQCHRLTDHKADNAERSPKRALAEVTGGDRRRERRCWMGVSLDTLRERGVENGLADYLREVGDRLRGLFGVPSAGR